MSVIKCTLLVSVCAAISAFPSHAVAITMQGPVFTAGEDGYSCFRIPAIVITKEGTLLAFCEGRVGSCSDTGDIDLVLKRRTKDGAWSALQVVVDDGVNTCGNPAPVVDRNTGDIILPITKNAGDTRESKILTGEGPPRTVWVTRSSDDGVTWSTPVDISEQTRRPDFRWYATGPGHSIQLMDGTIVVPCDHSLGPEKTSWYSHVIRSSDGGFTWELGGIAGPKTNECSVAQLADGRLYLNMRSYHGSTRRFVSHSDDGGTTWSPVEESDLVEPVCQASTLYVNRGEPMLLFSNPTSEKRENMTIHQSTDDGTTWSEFIALHKGPAAYSDLAAGDEGTLYCLYECGDKSPYERIVLATIQY